MECCNLSEYVGQLFLTLLTKYPVKLEEIYLEKNSAMLDSTRQLISECLSLKSRRNSDSSEQHVLVDRLSLHDNASTTTDETISERIEPTKLKKKKKKQQQSTVQPPTKIINTKEEMKSVTFIPIKHRQEENREEEIEELHPVEIEPYGTVGRLVYWNRV